MNKSTEATPEDANHSLARRIGDEPQKFWDKVLWTDFMDQSDGKAKVWRKKLQIKQIIVYDLQEITISVYFKILHLIVISLYFCEMY